MSISCAVKMVILSVSGVEYSISSSEMQNAAAVLASKFWRQPNKYVYSLYTRLIVLLPSKLQFQDYAFFTCFRNWNINWTFLPSPGWRWRKAGAVLIYGLVFSDKITHFIIDWLTVFVKFPAYLSCGSRYSQFRKKFQHYAGVAYYFV